jgi:HK97 family phage major capsid protein
MDRITEIQARLAAINAEIDNATGEALTALETESRTLLEELQGLQNDAQARQQLRQQIAAGAGNPVSNPAPAQPSAEERAAQAFAQTNRMTIEAEQARALTVAGGQLAQPTRVDGINDLPGASVSSIIDLVKVVNCTGMGSHKVAYLKEDAAAAGEQTEGEAAATASLAQFGFGQDLIDQGGVGLVGVGISQGLQDLAVMDELLCLHGFGVVHLISSSYIVAAVAHHLKTDGGHLFF